LNFNVLIPLYILCWDFILLIYEPTFVVSGTIDVYDILVLVKSCPFSMIWTDIIIDTKPSEDMFTTDSNAEGFVNSHFCFINPA
jgi:hypothetical protein